MFTLLKRLGAEWRLVRRAPLVFVGAALVGAAVALVAARSYFSAEITRLHIALNAKERQIASAPCTPPKREDRPRALTIREKQYLLRVLSQAPSRAVVYLVEPIGDPDAIRCMKDLDEVLLQAGWKAHTDNPNLTPDIGASFWRALPGFVLFVNDKDDTPGAKFLAEAMTVAGFAIRWGGDPRLPPNTCELLLGAAPGKERGS